MNTLISGFTVNKMETCIFSILYSFAICISILSLLNENWKLFNSNDEFDLSRNKRNVEIVNEYYLPIESMISYKEK